MASELDFTAAMDSACTWKLNYFFGPTRVVPVLGPVAYAAALAPLSEAVNIAHGLRRNAPQGLDVDQDDRVLFVHDGVMVVATFFCYVPSPVL